MRWHRHVPRRIEERGFRVEKLASEHDLTSFISSNSELTRYLKEDALEDQGNKTSATHLLLSRSDEVLGYFTLLTDSLRLEYATPEGPLQGYRYSSIPALKIARLSAGRGMERRGLGTAMLDLSFSYLFEISNYAGCRVMTVDSKKGCEGFYEKYGFRRANLRRRNTIPMYLDVKSFLESKDRSREFSRVA